MAGNLLRTLLVTSLLLGSIALTGCSVSSGTPQDAARSFFTALQTGNFSTAYDLLTDAQKARLSRELVLVGDDESAGSVERLNTQFGTDFTRDELKGISPASFFERALTSARTTDKTLEAMLRDKAEVLDAELDDSGEVATVQVRLAAAGLKQYRLMKESGGWRIQFSR